MHACQKPVSSSLDGKGLVGVQGAQEASADAVGMDKAGRVWLTGTRARADFGQLRLGPLPLVTGRSQLGG